MSVMSEDFRLQLDEENRRRALERQSFIVEAPAGAGKTELLTQRYLRLLAEVDEPEEILAITFTNKAAAEMRQRILSSLERAERGPVPEEPHKRITFDLARAALARGWPLVAQPQRLRILTIDALCALLARQMPFLSRFGRQPAVSMDAARHYAEAARRTLLMIAEEAGYADIVAEALLHLDNNVARLTGLLVGMLARREQWLRHCNRDGGGAGEETESALAVLVQHEIWQVAQILTAERQQALMPLARYAADNLEEDSPITALRGWTTILPEHPDALPQWRGLCELLLTSAGGFRKSLTKNCGFPAGKEGAAQKQAMADFLGHFAEEDAERIARIRNLPGARYIEEERRLVEVLAKLLNFAAGQLWVLFGETGEVDFVEVAQRALEALGSEEAPTDLALQMDYRVRHLLVDEFQDTSPLQTELLARLVAGWQIDAQGLEREGRTLFAVGDPMQSIYRFRKADVGLFLSVAQRGVGPLPLQRLNLYRNNRSCPAVIDWINRSFCDIFPKADKASVGAIQYRPFSAGRHDLDGLPEVGIQVHPLLREAGDDAGTEAACIVELIRKQREADPSQRIAVLVKARSHLVELVSLIRRAHDDLRFQAVEIESLADRQTMQDLLSLTRALLHRGDRLHLLAVLRAPWCGLTLADLHALAGENHDSALWPLMQDEARVGRLSEDGQHRLRHVREVLGEAWAQQGRMRLSRWVESVWLALGGAACLAEGSEAGELGDVRAFFDLLDELDSADRFSLETLENELAGLFAAVDPLADDRLQFMTIHKSKGLEFDVVILPGLHRGSRSDDPPLMLWEEVVMPDSSGAEMTRLIAAPYGMNKKGNRDATPTAYDFLREVEKERGRNEGKRVLYVAATRAIRQLHLVGEARLNKDGEPCPPSGSFLHLLWEAPGVADAFVRKAARLAESGAGSMEEVAVGEEVGGEGRGGSGQTPFIPALVRLKEVGIPDVLRLKSVEPERMDAQSVVRTDGLTGENEADSPVTRSEPTGPVFDTLSADIGSLLHLYLELLAGEAAQGKGLLITPEQLECLKPAMQQWLKRRGHDAARCEEGAEQVLAALRVTLSSESGRWLLFQQQDAASELALTSAEGSGQARYQMHVVDRCFVSEGVRWIVDYKTARVEMEGSANTPSGHSLSESMLQTHAERYRAQLERYAQLFRDEGFPQKLAIYYARYGRLVMLES